MKAKIAWLKVVAIPRSLVVGVCQSLSYPFVEITKEIAECPDPNDDMFLELAVSGNADYLITGNLKDFPPSPFQGLPILSPAAFLETVLWKK